MMKLALVVLIACVSSTLADKVACDVDNFKTAQDNFAKNLGIPTSDNWAKPLDLFLAIHNYYGGDAKLGLVKVCNYFNAMLDELNGKNIDVKTCFDPLFILGHEQIPDEGLHYLGVIGALRFQCGAGLYPVMDNDRWPCASKVFGDSGAKMVKVISDLIKSTDVDRVNRCQMVKDNEIKYYKPLHDACSTPETSYFGCQTFNQFFNAMYADCSNECKLIA
ncbi:hypothetical protein M3Y97_00708700 [Aphelenchoides bicaudatus]|nr:hypothetical protein M3Y97_00708700 [Aphelenchoides bicaudatus]